MPAPDFDLKFLNFLSTKPTPKSCELILRWLRNNNEAAAKTFSRLTTFKPDDVPKGKALRRLNQVMLNLAGQDSNVLSEHDKLLEELEKETQNWSHWKAVISGLRYSLSTENVNYLLPRTIARIEVFDDVRAEMSSTSDPLTQSGLLQKAYGHKPTPPITKLINWSKTARELDDRKAVGEFIGLYGLSTLVFDVAHDYAHATRSPISITKLFEADTLFLGWLGAVEGTALRRKGALPKRWLEMALGKAENHNDLKSDTYQTFITKSSTLRGGKQRLSFGDLSGILDYLESQGFLNVDDRCDLTFFYGFVVYVQNLQSVLDELAETRERLTQNIFGSTGAPSICAQLFSAFPESLTHSNGQ